MDRITRGDISPWTERELSFPHSPKRPRTDCAVTDGFTGNSRLDSSEPSTPQKTTSYLSPSNPLETKGPSGTAECEDFQDAKPHVQSQDSYADVTTSDSNGAHAGSSEVCFIGPEKHPVVLMSSEQPPATKTNQLSLYLSDGTCRSLPSASTNTPSVLDCRHLGEPLKDEVPDNCCLSTENGEDEEVRCQSDYTYKDAVHVTGLCNTWSQFAEVVEAYQRSEELDFIESISFSEAEGECPDFKPLNSYLEEDSSGNFPEGGKIEENILELLICKTEIVSICEEEIKDQVRENGLSKSLIPTAEKCDEESLLSNNMLFDTNIVVQNGTFEVDNYSGAAHTAEIPMLERISQEPAEGDNDADPFSVTDPAIRSEIERVCRSSDCTAAVELSPSEKVCKIEAPLPFCSDVRTSQRDSSPDQTAEFNQQSRTQQYKDKNEVLHQSSESQACFNETCGVTGNEGNFQSESSSSSSSSTKPRPAGDDGVQESRDPDRHQLKEQSQSSCFPASTDHTKKRQVGYSQTETDRVEETAEIEEREEVNFLKEMESDEQGDLENAITSKEKLLLKNEQDKEDSFIDDQRERERQKYDSGFNCTDAKLGSQPLCEEPLCADICEENVATERKEGKGRKHVETGLENSEFQPKSEVAVQKQSKHKDDEGISGWTEGSRLTFCGDDQEQSLRCFSDHRHREDTSTAETEDQLSAFNFPLNDAVVPCQQNLIHSQKAHHNSPELKCSDRFLPSALTLHNHVPEGFDTFEKIQLSPDDDDDAAGLGSLPVLTSSPRQLLKTPQQQLRHHMPMAESDSQGKIPGEEEVEGGDEEDEEEVERSGRHIDMSNGFVSSDSTGNEVPNFIPAADVRQPEQQPSCRSACDPSDHTHDELHPQPVCSAVHSESEGSSSGPNYSSEFEMKEEFNRVLKELNLFFDISRNDVSSDSRPPSPEGCCDLPETLMAKTSTCTEHLSSPELGHRNTGSYTMLFTSGPTVRDI